MIDILSGNQIMEPTQSAQLTPEINETIDPVNLMIGIVALFAELYLCSEGYPLQRTYYVEW